MLTPLPPLARAESVPRTPPADAPSAADPGTRFADLLRERHASAAPSTSRADAADAPDDQGSAPSGRGRRPLTTAAGGARRPAAPPSEKDAASDPPAVDALATTAVGDGATPVPPALEAATDARRALPEDEHDPASAQLAPGALHNTALLLRSAGDGAPAVDAPAARPAGAKTTRDAARLAAAQSTEPGPRAGSTAEAAATQQATPGPLPAVPGELPRAEPPRAGSEPTGIAAPPSFTRALAPHVAPPAVALATPLAAPDFGAALASQVSVFARDGVQQAELRLNPPDMGPIGVQIEVVGNDARINFHAAQAQTRELIERALPELAGALRGEGLTLAGGGVFDRPRDTSEGRFAPDRESGRPVRTAGAPAPAAPARPRPVRMGGVDLYA